MDSLSPNLLSFPSSPPWKHHYHHNEQSAYVLLSSSSSSHLMKSAGRIRASGSQVVDSSRTCRICKKQFKPSENHPRACFHHIAHYGGETKRKFESVHTGGTLDTPGGGEISSYWHCCGNEDPYHPGCVAGPHSSYDD